MEGSAENIVDLRRCVNLEGGGIYYNNMLFDQLIQRNVHYIPFVDVDARHSTFRIFLTNCYGRPTYLLVPGDVIRCPFCNRSFWRLGFHVVTHLDCCGPRKCNKILFGCASNFYSYIYILRLCLLIEVLRKKNNKENGFLMFNYPIENFNKN